MALHLANPAAAAQSFTTAVGSPSNGWRSQEPVFTVRLSHSITVPAAAFCATSSAHSKSHRTVIVIASADPSNEVPISTALNPNIATLSGLDGRSRSSGGKPSRPLVVTSAAASSAGYVTQLGGGGGDGAGGSSGGGGGGSGGGGGGDGLGGEGNAGDAESDYGPILGWAQAEEALSKAGVTLPEDMLAHLKEHGIAQLLLQRYIDLQVGGGILAAATRAFAGLRNRLLADPAFLFKVFTEIVIDSGCATFAEVRKRGDDFWKEFDLYMSDILVGFAVVIDSGCATFAEVRKRGDDFWKEFDLYMSDILVGFAVDAALVSMLAPMARFGSSAAASAARGRRGLVPPGLAAALEALPSSMFEAALPGRRYSVVQRGATWLVKGGQYAVVGFSCGLIGQAMTTAIVLIKRCVLVAGGRGVERGGGKGGEMGYSRGREMGGIQLWSDCPGDDNCYCANQAVRGGWVRNLRKPGEQEEEVKILSLMPLPCDSLVVLNLRKPGEHEEEVKIPGMIPTALLWGGFMAVSSNTRYQIINRLESCGFMAVSSNTRYQIINGLERVVESSPLARSMPLGARIFTVLIRFSNNIFGSSQFVEVARWSGVQ
ncbi:unnamed protein product [Closterium sp. NIES-64]|nr:unnamed protein product [Closterium sp. NIES-64]CAI5961559.1 unnamed protein product [Closterium sp. NIES-64]